MLWHHYARVNSHQRWKQTRFRVCFHLWCELTITMNVTKWQVSWNSCSASFYENTERRRTTRHILSLRHVTCMYMHTFFPVDLSSEQMDGGGGGQREKNFESLSSSKAGAAHDESNDPQNIQGYRKHSSVSWAIKEWFMEISRIMKWTRRPTQHDDC